MNSDEVFVPFSVQFQALVASLQTISRQLQILFPHRFHANDL
jgi:hypothetical protein